MSKFRLLLRAFAWMLSIISVCAWGYSGPEHPKPDAEFTQFLMFPIDMPQQEFRYAIRRNWLPTDAMYSKKQNRNFIGEYDEGYFEYERHPRATLEPVFTFRFRNSMLTESTALLFRFDGSGNDEIRQIASQVIKLVSEIYGEPTESENLSAA